MLSNPSGYSTVTDWNKIVQYNPEVLVLAPCRIRRETRCQRRVLCDIGFPVGTTFEQMVNDEVYVADADMFTQPSVHSCKWN